MLVLPNKTSTSSALDDFAARETNRALLTRAAVAEALQLLHENGLPLHNDTPKNWDTLLALYHAVRTTARNALVLDAGAETYSSFLPSLARLGFTNLLGVNLTFDASQAPVRVGPIEFTGLSYLLGFVLPNFYFHVTTAYDILRHNGVELGKLDYLGGAK